MQYSFKIGFLLNLCSCAEIDKLPAVRDSIPLALRMRAAVGTALGAAAAHARLLADQEEREIEHLMAFIIETQVNILFIVPLVPFHLSIFLASLST